MNASPQPGSVHCIKASERTRIVQRLARTDREWLPPCMDLAVHSKMLSGPEALSATRFSASKRFILVRLVASDMSLQVRFTQIRLATRRAKKRTLVKRE